MLEISEVEEGEIADVEDEIGEGKEGTEVSESEFLEDELLEKQERENLKTGVKKGRGRGQKAKAQTANPGKSIRSSRRQH